MADREEKREFEVTAEQEGERLDRVLSRLYPEQSRSFFQNLIRKGAVTVNSSPAEKTGRPVSAGDLVTVRIPQAESADLLPQDIPLAILYEDSDVLIVNKPKGMVVHPAPGHGSDTLVNAVLYHCRDSLSGINGELRPGIVHRIDKDTTGALLVCKNDAAHEAIARQIAEHSVTRRYRGIVCGVIREEEGIIDRPIGRHPTDRKRMAVNEKNGRPAVTHYRVLERFSRYTYLEFRLETGRTHQIRVHMESLHHPLLGDAVYGGCKKEYAVAGLSGQTLHAMTIGFVHPTTGEYMEFTAPLPDYFEELLRRFRG